MARGVAFTVENNFRNGLITEASGLNFPENACTETWNCIFEADGTIHRRLGIDYETSYSQKTVNRENSVVATYLWKNVAGDGNTTLLVVQVGATLYFYETDSATMSAGAIASTVALTSFDATGAPDTSGIECQFSSGNGLLFVTHPYCDPFYVSYNTSTQTATGTAITLKIRDFEGVSDGLAIDDRPTSTLAALSDTHRYNLNNQGWNTTNLTAWDTAQTTMPSNADVMWTFVDSSGNFDASTAAINRVVRGNTPAPKGHYIVTLHDIDRDAVSGLSGLTAVDTGYQRPSTSAFFAGRVFYAGTNYVKYNSTIYFTQIVERTEQYGFCYQANDPTAEDSFDLLPSDGGSIAIPEAGTIYKLIAMTGGLAVFAANGVWFVSGSTGLGFTANDYVVQKLSSVATLSADSFVEVAGAWTWWTTEGIYILSSDGQNPQIQSLTDAKIRSFYHDIPTANKRRARGAFNPSHGVVRWLYKSTLSEEVTDLYEFDQMLNLNIQTGAFYPWALEDSDVKINGIFSTDLDVGALTVNTVVRTADTVVDSFGNTVVTYSSLAPSVTADFRYIVSTYYEDGSTNICLQSQTFDNATWTKTRSSISADAATAPNSSATADSVINTVDNNTHLVRQSITVAADTIYTFSVYAKADELTHIHLLLPSAAFGTNRRAIFDLSLGTATVETGTATATITSAGSGWYRCAITATATVAGAANFDLYVSKGTLSYTGNGTDNLYIWGAQLEAASTATTYIATVAAAVSRDTAYNLTFAQDIDTTYVDWSTADSTAFTSYFITGYKLRGDAIRKFQPTWVRLYSYTDTAYNVTGYWDYASAADANRWSSSQVVTHPASDFTYTSTRRKIRGHGQALQLKISSETGEPFWLLGWATMDTGNQMP